MEAGAESKRSSALVELSFRLWFKFPDFHSTVSLALVFSCVFRPGPNAF